MEKVHHNGIQRQATPFVFTGHGKQFFLGAVAQLALPIAHAVFRHHGAHAGDGGILLFNFSRGIAGSNVIIQLHAAVGLPFGLVGAEGHRTDGRIVPKEAIPPAGYIEGHAGLAVAVCQFQGGAFFVQMFVLILAHAENLFIVIGFKPCHHGKIIAAGHRPHFPCRHPKGHAIAVQPVTVAPVFFRQKLALLIVKADPAFHIHPGFNFAVFQRPSGGRLMILFPFFTLVPGVRIINGFAGNFCSIFRQLFRQSPIIFIHFCLPRHADAQAVFPPGFNPGLMGAVCQNKAVSFLINCHRKKSSVLGYCFSFLSVFIIAFCPISVNAAPMFIHAKVHLFPARTHKNPFRLSPVCHKNNKKMSAFYPALIVPENQIFLF